MIGFRRRISGVCTDARASAASAERRFGRQYSVATIGFLTDLENDRVTRFPPPSHAIRVNFRRRTIFNVNIVTTASGLKAVRHQPDITMTVGASRLPATIFYDRAATR